MEKIDQMQKIEIITNISDVHILPRTEVRYLSNNFINYKKKQKKKHTHTHTQRKKHLQKKLHELTRLISKLLIVNSINVTSRNEKKNTCK